MSTNKLRLKRLGIDTHQGNTVYMRRDCHICRAEGFSAHGRIQITKGAKSIIATLNHVTGDLLAPGEAGLSETAWKKLAAGEADEVLMSHPPTLDSLSRLRAKVYGESLSQADFSDVIGDVVAGRYSDIHVASFITACTANSLDRAEILGLTRAMVAAGDRLDWGTEPIVDKHCVGGLPGNRTTPIIVSIIAACGLIMPKTSSRAITSPAGTADTMETLAPVNLDLASLRHVVEQEGGCIVWGGAVALSPADDILIRIERALDLDSEGQLVASVLSKKVAAGSTHLVLDLPVGPTAKIRSTGDAASLGGHLHEVGHALGLRAKIVQSDGLQPVGRGIGPALEARDVLAVLQDTREAPQDLRIRAVTLAGALLELAGAVEAGDGMAAAQLALDDGRAWRKFQSICAAQGGMREPPRSSHRHPILAQRQGLLAAIDNRRLAMVAKLAGAPDAKAAGLELHVKLGQEIEKGMPLMTLHAESRGELSYALEYVASHPPIIDLAGAH